MDIASQTGFLFCVPILFASMFVLTEETSISARNFHLSSPPHQQMAAPSSTADCLCRLGQLLCHLLAERLSRELEEMYREQEEEEEPSSVISEDAIRDLPGYWIKRPAPEVSRTEAIAKHGSLSPLDYRTERYRITDLFPDIPPDGSNNSQDDPKIIAME